MPDALICTIGHSSRLIEDFVGLLWANEVGRVIAVRTIPRSRHNPQFHRDVLPVSLADARIDYTHMPGLGGLRHACMGSPKCGRRSASFRG